jgi:hypothetical protein
MSRRGHRRRSQKPRSRGKSKAQVKPKITLEDKLMELHLKGGKATHRVNILNPRDGHYISGNPYLWSGYQDRAYVFDKAIADALIAEYPELAGCETPDAG